MMRRLISIVFVLGLVLWTASASLAQGYGGGRDAPAQPPTPPPPPAASINSKAVTQLRTGIDHARNAAGSGAMTAAVSHLGHVLNCIEGTRGKNFNASWGHVCQGQGDGIVVDIKSAKNAGQVMLVLDAADGLATSGVRATDLPAVQSAARGVGSLLQIVLDGIR